MNGVRLIVVALFFSVACTPAQTDAWKKIGIATAKNCGGAAAVQAVKEFQDQAALPGATAQSVAEAVAESVGLDAALCAARELIAGGAAFFRGGGESSVGDGTWPPDRVAYEAASYLIVNRNEMPARLHVLQLLRRTRR